VLLGHGKAEAECDGGVIFDRLCGIVERVYPNAEIKALLKQARIFEFPGRLHEVAKGRDWDSMGGSEFLMEHFFLPFPVVAIEDTASCVVIADDHPGQKGLNVSRTFIECLDLTTPIEEFGASMQNPDEVLRYRQLRDRPTPIGACSVTVSQLERARLMTDAERAVLSTPSTGLVFEGSMGLTFVASKDEMVVNPVHAQQAMFRSGTTGQVYQATLRNAAAALEEVMFFNTPDRFIVERSPDVVRKPKAKGLPEIRRSNERPHYILLRPEEIRERFGLSDDAVHDRRSPTPHARRRHYRTLRDDRFTNKAGQTIVVKASWVGPEEGEFRGRRYKVCLEL